MISCTILLHLRQVDNSDSEDYIQDFRSVFHEILVSSAPAIPTPSPVTSRALVFGTAHAEFHNEVVVRRLWPVKSYLDRVRPKYTGSLAAHSQPTRSWALSLNKWKRIPSL